MKTYNTVTKASGHAFRSSGAFFDAPQYRERLKSLEARVANPEFWNNQEAAQAVLRDRKRAEEQIAADDKLTCISGDIETYISLAGEETNAAQRNDLLKDLDRELTAAENYVAELETRTLLSGETDHGPSFSLYVHDPDGNELEIFWLLPREEWERKPVTRELNLAEKVKERTAAAV